MEGGLGLLIGLPLNTIRSNPSKGLAKVYSVLLCYTLVLIVTFFIAAISSIMATAPRHCDFFHHDTQGHVLEKLWWSRSMDRTGGRSDGILCDTVRQIYKNPVLVLVTRIDTELAVAGEKLLVLVGSSRLVEYEMKCNIYFTASSPPPAEDLHLRLVE